MGLRVYVSGSAGGYGPWLYTDIVVMRTVLLQSSDQDRTAVDLGHPQATMSNSEFTKAAWVTMSSPRIAFTCPFLIIAKVSYPTRPCCSKLSI
jgi:hypothetical protein